MIIVEKESNNAITVDIASPWDHRGYEKERQKIDNYRDLKRELIKLYGLSDNTKLTISYYKLNHLKKKSSCFIFGSATFESLFLVLKS